MIGFRLLSTITAILTFALFINLLFVPEVIFMLFHVQGGESAFFISRRAAMLFLCISVFTWFGRNALHSESRQAICIGMSISMAGMAILGLFEYFRNFVGVGIFLAVVTEVALSVAYFQIWVSSKPTHRIELDSIS